MDTDNNGQKVEMQARRRNPRAWRHPDHCETDLRKCLPFYRSTFGRSGGAIHRVRSGTIYWDRGEYSHLAVQLWCGAGGFPGKKGTLLAAAPAEAAMCAGCERKGRGE